MGKFSRIAQGERARKPFTFTLLGGVEATCALVPLLGDDEIEVLAGARAMAVAKGVAKPEDGNPIYELARWAHTLARACVDPDSPVDAPEPFFDGGVAQILDAKRGLDRDRIALIYEAQLAWQDDCAPRPKNMTGAEFIAEVMRHAAFPEGAELPFESWRPVLRRSFVRTMAVQHIASLQLPSLFGSDSPAGEKSSDASATPSPAPEGAA